MYTFNESSAHRVCKRWNLDDAREYANDMRAHAIVEDIISNLDHKQLENSSYATDAYQSMNWTKVPWS